jgi:hypothetical protein
MHALLELQYRCRLLKEKRYCMNAFDSGMCSAFSRKENVKIFTELKQYLEEIV